jgi:hypothetical protein
MTYPKPHPEKPRNFRLKHAGSPNLWEGRIISKRYDKNEKTKHGFYFYLFTLYSLCLRVFVAETQSIKNNKLCETNPISEKPKMNLTHHTTMDYDNKSALLTMKKQTQTKPISKWRKPRGASRPHADLTAGKLTIKRKRSRPPPERPRDIQQNR